MKLILTLGLILLALSSRAQVVINEIFYHAPDDLDDLQWVELYNTSDQPVNLSGWRLAKATKFDFKPNSTIAAHGYLIICKDKQRFQEFYHVPVFGEFSRALKHSESRLELKNSSGQVVDSIEYSNHLPWPRGPDGRTASLERICPTSPGNNVANWTGSPLSEDATQPAGTPGEKNASFSPNLPSVISKVSFPSTAVAPEQAVRIEADVRAQGALREVVLLFRLLRPGSISEETAVPMTKAGADSRYAASIPGQQAGQVVRFRIRATDQNDAERVFPSPTEPRPALSYVVFTNVALGKIPAGYLVHGDPEEVQSALRQVQNNGGASPTSPEGQGRFMAQMQIQAAMDLPGLWAALTLTNAAAGDLEKLRSVFRQKEQECDSLQRNILSGTNVQESLAKIPELITPVKTSLGDSLKSILNADQMTTFASWRDAAPPGGRMNNDPVMMLRQFIRLEPGYLHLATMTNVTATQLMGVRDLYRDSIQQRDALVPELRKLMSNQRPDDQEGGKFQTYDRF